MSSIGRLLAARRHAKRFDPVSLEEFGALVAGRQGGGMSKAGVAVGQDRAMGITAWYSGVRYLAEHSAFIPIDSFQRLGGDGRQSVADPLWMAGVDDTWRGPDTGWTREQLVEAWMLSLLHRGFAAGFKLRDFNSRVVGMRYLHPDRVIPVADPETGRRVYRVKMSESRWMILTERDILWIPFMTFDGITPISPLRYHADSLGTVAATDELAASLYSNGTLIRDYIKLDAPAQREHMDRLKAEFAEFHKGLRNAHATPVLSAGASYETVMLNADDAQLLESRKFGVSEVARILRIPPHKLYDLDRATFNNIEHQSIEAVGDSIWPWVRRFETVINADADLTTPSGFIEFNLDGLLRGDIKTRYEAYHLAIADGWMSLDEPRRRENFAPQDGMAVAYRPLNMAVVDPETGQESGGGRRAQDLKTRIDAAGVLIRSGFTNQDALNAVGLDPIKHTGLLPVTLKTD